MVPVLSNLINIYSNIYYFSIIEIVEKNCGITEVLYEYLI